MKQASAHDEKERLFRHALRGLKWNYAGTIARIASQLLAQITLARLLGPDVNGQFAAVVLALSLFTIWAEMGLGSAMVQTSSEDEQIEHDRACTRLILVSVALALLAVVLAEPIARYWLSSPSSVTLLQVMALTAPLTALNVPPTVRMRRALDFKSIQIIQLTSYMGGYLLIGIPWAWLSGSPWSLVGAWISQLIIGNAMSWYVSPAPFKFTNPGRRCKWTRFGLAISATNTVNWTLDNLIPLCINLIFGAHALGIFNITNNLVKTPANHLVISLQNVLFPFSSRLQQDRAALERIFTTASAAIMLVSVPVFLTVVILSEPVVRILLGEKWLEAASVLRPLSAAMIPHTLMAIAGPILNAAGRPQKELHAQAMSMVLLVVAAILTRDQTIETMCWVMAGIFTFRALWMIRAVTELLEIPMIRLLKTHAGPVMLGLLVVMVTSATRLLTASSPTVWQLAAGLVCAGLTFVAGLLLCPRLFLPTQLAEAVLKIFQGRHQDARPLWTRRLLKGL